MAKDAKDVFVDSHRKELNPQTVDVQFTFRRTSRQPLEDNQLISSYAKLEEEMKNPNSSIYRGQIVVTDGPENATGEYNPAFYTPYLIKNDGVSNTSYYAERIATVSYTNAILDTQYVKKNQLGTTYTGVGQWYDTANSDGSTPTSTYSEIFNDYVNNKTSKADDTFSKYAHAEGVNTNAGGDGSHAEGNTNTTYAQYSHVEGINNTIAETAIGAHVEGSDNTASGVKSHVEGGGNTARGTYSHAQGINNIASGLGSSASGVGTSATGMYSATFGEGTTAGDSSISAGVKTETKGYGSASFGYLTSTDEDASYAFATGVHTYANTVGSHTEGYFTKTTKGAYAHAEGSTSVADGYASHSEGYNTQANGTYSHAEGNTSIANNEGAHAEGYNTQANGTYSHAEGNTSIANNEGAHVEGLNNQGNGDYSHVEGYSNIVNSAYSHVSGQNNTSSALSTASNVEGAFNYADTAYGHIEGIGNVGYAPISHVEGSYGYLDKSANTSHIEGTYNASYSSYGHVEGRKSIVRGEGAHAEGLSTNATGNYSHTEGNSTYTEGIGAHAEGNNTKAVNNYTHSEGINTKASGIGAHVEGGIVDSTLGITEAAGDFSHAEGVLTTANGEGSHTEGYKTVAGNFKLDETVSKYSHAEGYKSHADGDWSHAEGEFTGAYATASHATGLGTAAKGTYSATAGYYTQTFNASEIAIGTYNRSYTTGSFNSGNKITEIPNEFARLNGQYVAGRYPAYTAGADGTYYYDSSYETLFTVGDGLGDEYINGVGPLDIKDGHDAGQQVREGRHNIMDIRKNGQMYYSGGIIAGGEIVAPMSYSYVASLGPTAYFTTIMAALLTQPEYYKPSLHYKLDNRGEYNFNSSTFTISTQEVGSSISKDICFCGHRIAHDVDNHMDPIYNINLGNMLGYSVGITEIIYKYNKNDNRKASEMNKDFATYTISFTSDSPKTYLAGTCSLGMSDSAGNFDAFKYNSSQAVATSATYKSISNLKLGTETTYDLYQVVSYTFAPPTSMVFQQLANKGTYISAAGEDPHQRWNQNIKYASNNHIVKVDAKYKYYYGYGKTDKSVEDIDFDGLIGNNTGGSWVPNGITTISKTQGIGECNYVWFAIPACLGYITRYDNPNVTTKLFLYYKNSMNAESPLDSGWTTSTAPGGSPIYTKLTKDPMGNAKLTYRIYCCKKDKGSFTPGTWGFAWKRTVDTGKDSEIPNIPLDIISDPTNV